MIPPKESAGDRAAREYQEQREEFNRMVAEDARLSMIENNLEAQLRAAIDQQRLGKWAVSLTLLDRKRQGVFGYILWSDGEVTLANLPAITP